MSAITNTNSSSLILQQAYQGALNGGVNGAKVGIFLVTGTVASGMIQGLVEKGNRSIGNEPKWPIFLGDCELEQFRDMYCCTNPPLFDSFISFTGCVIGATTVGGMIVGAVSAAARGVFAKEKSE